MIFARSSQIFVLFACLGLTILSTPAQSVLAQMTSVVSSLADDEDAYPYDDPDTEDIDESVDGVCGDAQGRCTLRAALDEASYMNTFANVSFSVAGTIMVDSNMGTLFPPSGSTVDGNGRAVTLRGQGSYPFLMAIDSETTVRGLIFRKAFDALDVAGNHNIIGGKFTTQGNMFLGMEQNAVALFGDHNLVIGNQIGIGADGDAIGVAPNGDTVYNQFGVFVIGSYNIIGDSMGTYRNVISRNLVGISMVGADSTEVPCLENSVRGNMIGTDLFGTGRKSNGYGIEFLYGGNHLVGAAGGDGFNIISGNRIAGILVGIGTSDVTIAENLIGLDIGQNPLGNVNGVILGPGSSDCLVYNNLIQHNSAYGIEIAGGHAAFNYPSTRHIVAGNKVNFNGLGIVMGSRATENVIGSSLSVDRAPNEIQSNSQGGVLIASPVGTPNEARLNTVRKNLFLDNYEDAIVVVQAQDDIVPPAVMSYDTTGGLGYVTGTHDRAGSTIDVYEGKKFNDTWYEGYTWLGSSTVQADSSFIVSFPACGCRVVAVTATDPAGNTSAFSIFQQGAEVVEAVDAMTTGWNMGSVPVNPLNSLATTVFSGATGSVFAYTPTGYTAQASVSVGPGYWVRYASATNQHISGYAVTTDTFEVMAGWNMVGSITDPVPVSQVGSIPGGMISSNFFEYNGFYQASDTIRPGRAYWVKVGQAGSLTLSSAGNTPVAGRIRVMDTPERPPEPPVMTPAGDLRTITEPGVHGWMSERPATSSTPISYRLRSKARVTLSVFDNHGEQVATLVDGVQEAGYKQLVWNTTGLTRGLYHYELRSGEHVLQKRPIVVN